MGKWSETSEDTTVVGTDIFVRSKGGATVRLTASQLIDGLLKLGVGSLDDSGTPASGDKVLIADAGDSSIVKTGLFSTFSGGTAPTRHTLTLSGTSATFSIPASVTRLFAVCNNICCCYL